MSYMLIWKIAFGNLLSTSVRYNFQSAKGRSGAIFQDILVDALLKMVWKSHPGCHSDSFCMSVVDLRISDKLWKPNRQPSFFLGGASPQIPLLWCVIACLVSQVLLLQSLVGCARCISGRLFVGKIARHISGAVV